MKACICLAKKLGLVFLVSVAALGGCAERSALIKNATNGTRSDIYREGEGGGQIPRGFADLRIVASLKTHRPGQFILETGAHGTQDYRMLINIDGQALQVPGDLHREVAGVRGFQDPESGDGMRYRFSTQLRLKAGSHKIVVAFPEDGVVEERELILSDASSNSLLAEPRYGKPAGKQRPGVYGTVNFREGVEGLRLALNGRGI